MHSIIKWTCNFVCLYKYMMLREKIDKRVGKDGRREEETGMERESRGGFDQNTL